MRRLWARWYGKLLMIGLVAVVVLVVAAFAAANYTEDDGFCGTSCHEMNPYFVTWQHSKHHNVNCVRCHIQPGPVNLVKAKVSALREVYVHFAGQVKAPIAVTRHVPNSTCLSCHPAGKGVDPIKLSGVSTVDFSHRAHAAITNCIDCHSQVVHRSVPGKPYIDPKTMAFCLRCHNDKVASGKCELCHTAPHPNRGRCVDCHQLGSWTTTFKHPVALGKPHRAVICEKCHTKAQGTTMGFPAGCVSCHGNHHHDAKATLCAKCHVPTYFVPSTFKHPKTGCQRCHTPPHPDRGPCLNCHTQRSWASHFRHPFPLAGPHVSFRCERCHTNGVSRPGRDCSGCHKPPHPAYGSCLTCHSMSSWASHFSHPIALGGVHASFPCSRCHVNGIGSPGIGCSSCHGSQHGGLTNCGQCHTMTSFVPSTFHHPAAGEHGAGSFACTACHPGGSFSRVYCSCHGGKPPSGD
jgi:nitrate/TMAO reductase-like tetraheme cytochrome c subunit